MFNQKLFLLFLFAFSLNVLYSINQNDYDKIEPDAAKIYYYTQKVDSLVIKAQQYEVENNYLETANSYNEAIKIIERYNIDYNNLSELYLYLASAYTYLGYNFDALNSLTTGYDIAKSKNQTDVEARILMNLGILKFYEGNYDASLNYYTESLDKAKELKNDNGISIAYNNIANVYQKKGDISQAINYYNKAMLIQKEINDSSSFCYILMNIASLSIEAEKIPQAEELLEEAIAIAQKINEVEVLSLCYMNKGILHNIKGNGYYAETQFDKALAIADKYNLLPAKEKILQELVNFFELQGKYEYAYNNLKKLVEIKNLNNIKEFTSNSAKFEAEYKNIEQERSLNKRTNQLKILKLIAFFTSIILIILAIVIIILHRVSKATKNNAKKLYELNTTKDKLFSIISHDLKSPVVAQKMAISNLLSQYDNISETDKKKYLRLLYDGVDTQTDLLENLLSWARMQTGKLSFNPIYFDLNEVVQNTKSLFEVYSKNKDISIISNLNKKLIVFADKIMITTVIRNLVSNSLKFSNPNTTININVIDDADLIYISVIDEGKGMTETQIKNIFDFESRILETGTKGEKGSGLGLEVCKEMLAKHNQILNIESELGKGTVISFFVNKFETNFKN